MKGLGNFPFREPHWAIQGVRFPNLLQELGKACPELHGVRVSRFVGGRFEGGGNIIRCRQGIKDQAGLSICLIHEGKAIDPDAVAKHQHRHIHQENNTEATLRLFQQLLSSESGSFRCQSGRMWDSGNGNRNRGQRPGWAYIIRVA